MWLYLSVLALPPSGSFLSNRLPGAMYASVPTIGLMPAALACLAKSYAPYKLPWSVIASAGMPACSHPLNKSLRRAAPSSIEYSVCTCRCTNESPSLAMTAQTSSESAPQDGTYSWRGGSRAKRGLLLSNQCCSSTALGQFPACRRGRVFSDLRRRCPDAGAGRRQELP